MEGGWDGMRMGWVLYSGYDRALRLYRSMIPACHKQTIGFDIRIGMI